MVWLLLRYLSTIPLYKLLYFVFEFRVFLWQKIWPLYCHKMASIQCYPFSFTEKKLRTFYSLLCINTFQVMHTTIYFSFKVREKLYTQLHPLYSYWFAYCIIAPVESASPDLKNLLLQNLIISTGLSEVFTIQILGEYSYSYTILQST